MWIGVKTTKIELLQCNTFYVSPSSLWLMITLVFRTALQLEVICYILNSAKDNKYASYNLI